MTVPSRATAKLRTSRAAAIFVPFALFAALASSAVSGAGIDWDGEFLRELHEQASPLLDRTMLTVSDLGGIDALSPIAVGVLTLLLFHRRWRDALFLAAATHEYGKLVVPTPFAHGGSLLSHARVRSPRCPSLASPVATPRQRSFPKLSTGRLAVGARRASARGGGARASCRERTVPTVPRSALRAGAVRRRREIAERCVAVRLVSIGAQVREPRMC